MPFPEHIARILENHRVQSATKAALYELYLMMGSEVLEVFGDIAETVEDVSALGPEETQSIRERVVERYLRRNHPLWVAGTPTASLWCPQAVEGRATGAAVPMGDDALAHANGIARTIVGPSQPLADGVLIQGRNAHLGGRDSTVSFDVVAAALDDAVAFGRAAGQQHTLPGSAGETSGSYDGSRRVGMIWEVQPNVFKPAGEKNRSIAKICRKHRNWHVVTLAAAISWFRAQQCAVFILRGEALATTHEVNPEKTVSETIVAHHNHTVAQVITAMGLTLSDPNDVDELQLLDSAVMNHALRQHVLRNGPAGAIWRVASN
jgi:hypothetical protein